MREILASLTQEHPTLYVLSRKKSKLQLNEIYCNIYKIIIYRVGGSKGIGEGADPRKSITEEGQNCYKV
jgi:hypothetical protein